MWRETEFPHFLAGYTHIQLAVRNKPNIRICTETQKNVQYYENTNCHLWKEEIEILLIDVPSRTQITILGGVHCIISFGTRKNDSNHRPLALKFPKFECHNLFHRQTTEMRYSSINISESNLKLPVKLLRPDQPEVTLISSISSQNLKVYFPPPQKKFSIETPLENEIEESHREIRINWKPNKVPAAVF